LRPRGAVLFTRQLARHAEHEGHLRSIRRDDGGCDQPEAGDMVGREKCFLRGASRSRQEQSAKAKHDNARHGTLAKRMAFKPPTQITKIIVWRVEGGQETSALLVATTARIAIIFLQRPGYTWVGLRISPFPLDGAWRPAYALPEVS